MPSQSSIDIVNTVFGGGKDLSDYVDSRMKELAMDSIDSMKQEVGKQMFTPTPEVPENPDESDEIEAAKVDAEADGTPSSVEPSDDTETEVKPDETDNGNDK
tara:strand:- start:1043 stop:1348 length:306 start_codon:yes stop_codon:yes gene_type:complete